MTAQSIEIITFQLNDSADKKAFLEAAQQTQEKVKHFPGFLHRSLSYNPDNNVWSDVIQWQSAEEAQHASKQFMQLEAAGRMLSHVDTTTLAVSYGSIEMQGRCKTWMNNEGIKQEQAHGEIA
ncbi:hypothetical protein CS022_01455 [Veronia nyctiphanis]|uniref:ABM domain-containing protein n=1 Tax=Veronia nyctiphanis TaxID=1278244 RepID=A0A4Q0YVH9_9GAMM|nr:hypothetical protein [Veronia nyctiphanis]RXJ74893.1 hypothetical protein CS022_01455 [Veronia nyctiphanis]